MRQISPHKCTVVFYHYQLSLFTEPHVVDGQNNKIDEELEELDEGHDGEAEPQTKNSA